uniref:Uncharacterized protein n=1 Tax=Canis lupus dingo TaxID=286419 RepID=A0A8C0KXT8_CANLU
MAEDVEGGRASAGWISLRVTGKVTGGASPSSPTSAYRLLRPGARSTGGTSGARPGGRPSTCRRVRARAAGARGPRPPPRPPPAAPPGPATAPRTALAYDYRFAACARRRPRPPTATAAKPRWPRRELLCGPPRGAGSPRTQHGSPGPSCHLPVPRGPRRPVCGPLGSLDDLARAAVAPPPASGKAGSFKACSVAGSWVCPLPPGAQRLGTVLRGNPGTSGPARERAARSRYGAHGSEEAGGAACARAPGAPSPLASAGSDGLPHAESPTFLNHDTRGGWPRLPVTSALELPTLPKPRVFSVTQFGGKVGLRPGWTPWWSLFIITLRFLQNCI